MPGVGQNIALYSGFAYCQDFSFLSLQFPRSGDLWMQKLKSHLMRTQSLKVLPLQAGVGQYVAMHATLTARDFFLC